MRVALLLTAAWLLALLGWLAGANTVEKPSENPPPLHCRHMEDASY
jgi:hypothetical protein